MRSRSWIYGCSLIALFGCGGETVTDADAGVDAAIGADAGSGEDAGRDATTPDDAGSDAGTPAPDADTPVLDAGSDAGTADPDAGSDAGTADASADAGGAMDAGPGGCVTNADCASGDYCMRPGGVCGGTGACAPRPGVCPGIFAPVCGCDASTYSSDCVAASNGVNVLHTGACSSSTCTMLPVSGCCFSNADCPSGTRCLGATCTSGGEGTCVDASLGPTQCWEDAECSDGRSCSGARRCPCGALCILPDAPGTCGAPAS